MRQRWTRRPLLWRAAAIVVPLGVIAGGTGAALSVRGPESEPVQFVQSLPSATPSVTPTRQSTGTSRNGVRPSVKPKATAKPKPAAKPTPTPTKERAAVAQPPKAVGSRYVTVNLNVRLAPLETAQLLTVLSAGTKVSITGKTSGGWAQIVYDGKALWVKAQYLATEKPRDSISAAPCASGSAVEDGLQPDTIRVHRAVCARFPSVTEYGGLRSGDDGEHGEGRALDIMVSGALGDEIAAWVRQNYKALGVSEVIWEQRIWTVQRADEGWRPMEDRGSATANHFDHVHVTVYGDRGTA